MNVWSFALGAASTLAVVLLVLVIRGIWTNRSERERDSYVAKLQAENRRLRDFQTQFRLTPEQWEVFTEALDRPPQDKPKLRALMMRKSVFEEPTPLFDQDAGPDDVA